MRREATDVAPYDVPAALSNLGWYRTPNGDWAGSPVVSPSALPNHALLVILAASGGPVHGIQQLPFQGFPPINYQPAGLPPVECRGVGHPGQYPIRRDLPSHATGTSSP